jgi:hypothetical protein
VHEDEDPPLMSRSKGWHMSGFADGHRRAPACKERVHCLVMVRERVHSAALSGSVAHLALHLSDAPGAHLERRPQRLRSWKHGVCTKLLTPALERGLHCRITAVTTTRGSVFRPRYVYGSKRICTPYKERGPMCLTLFCFSKWKNSGNSKNATALR